MEEVIRIIDVSVCNKNHYGLVFRKNADIKKYLKDMGYEYWKYYKSDADITLFISETRLNESSGRINILENIDMYGNTKSRIIYDEDIENIMENVKKNMKLIPSSLEEDKFCEVELCEETYNLLDGSTIYTISYIKVSDIDGKDVFIDDSVRLIKNVPIIDYKSSGVFKVNFTRN